VNVIRKGGHDSRSLPRVSVGLPVYNGERYLEEAIRSILSQTFSDFELIISDNASTDSTEEICRAISALDPRVRYYRCEDNQGLAWNWNRVFELASGEYFHWSAHDDLFAPEFLAAAVEVLDENPTVVLCYSKEQLINEAGEVIRDYETRLNRVVSTRLQDRFGDLVLIDHWCLPIYGLIRVCALRATAGYGNYVASDRVLLAELALHGRFHEIPEHLFMFRLHPGQSIQALAFHQRAAWINPSEAGRTVFPHWRFYAEYFRCLKRARLSKRERFSCYVHLVRWWRVNWNWARMVSDLMIATAPRSLNLLQRIQERIYGRDALPRQIQ
jgi:glycosyltransferase involved in cell wall biosynthesis